MKLLFIHSALFLLPLLGVASLKFGIVDFNDPLCFPKLIGRFVNGGDLQNKAEFEQVLDDLTESAFKNFVPGGEFIVQLKDKMNELYRPGGIPKKLTTQEIINQVEKEGARTRELILNLENTFKMAGFREIRNSIQILENSISRIFNNSFENVRNSTVKNLIEKEQELIEMAEKLKLMVTDDTVNIMQLNIEKDDLCTKKTLIDTQSSVMNLLNRLVYENFAAMVVSSLQEGRNADAVGIDRIALILNETRGVSHEYIENFKNRGWSHDRVERLIGKVVQKDRRGNLTKRADDLIKMLSKWHTSDAFAVIAKGSHGCDTGCAFQESFKAEDSLVVRANNITVVLSKTPITHIGDTKLRKLFNKKMEAKKSFTWFDVSSRR